MRIKSMKKCGSFKLCVGSKLQVMRGTAQRTSGGVTKDGLAYNRRGRIVYKSKQAAAFKNNNLFRAMANGQRAGTRRRRMSKRSRRT